MTDSKMQVQAPVALQQSPQPKFFQQSRFGGGAYQKTNNFFNPQQYRQHQHNNQNAQQGVEFDGKRLRKAVIRKTIDYNAAIVRQLELRVWQRDQRDFRAIQPDAAYYPDMIPPPYYVHNPINAVTTKFVRTSTNKMRCPIFCVAWTPEGRRLVTGASSGEFTLWNGLTFNFETILQAHDSPVRCMVWSHNDLWMVTGDHAGFVKYWQSNMNNVKMFQAHKEPLRGISFCPTDHKVATCSDDGTVRIWDFLKCHEEKILRGHGADVKCVAWHPHKGLLVSGSKDSQQPIKLWDPKSGQSLATLHAHKSTVMEAKWNHNGNWLLTASRDHLIKLFDIRKLSQEVQTFRGHKKEVTSLAWHPVHESLFASGGSDGAVMFWLNGVDKEVGSMEMAHDSIVWSLAWHPLGHILCSGSNDHTCKFWTRNRPGDKMRDKYNLNTLTTGNPDEAAEYDDMSTSLSIPGMGMEQQNMLLAREMDQSDSELDIPAIPGLDFGSEEPQLPMDSKMPMQKKVPYAKPIPRQFQQQWMENKRPLLVAPMGSQSNAPPPPGSEGGTMNPQQRGAEGARGFSSSRMMAPEDQQGGPRMPMGNMMWSPPDGQTGDRFSVGNGNQFIPPGGPGFSERERNNMPNQGGPPGGLNKFPQDKSEPGNWKEYGDSDLRIPMDSDLRLQNQGPDDRRRDGRDFSDNGSSGGGRETRLRGDAHDEDMRPRSKDSDSRMLDYNNHSKPNSEGNVKTTSSGRVRVSRWSNAPPVRGAAVPFGGTNMPPPGGNFGSNEPKRRDGDWDERVTHGRMGPPNDGDRGGGGGSNFSSPRKRGWDDGPGGGGGGGGGGRDSYDHMDNPKRNDNFSGPGFLQQPQNMGNQGPGRGMQSWGPNRGGRNDMRGGRGGRGAAFRGSGGRGGGMWGHN